MKVKMLVNTVHEGKRLKKGAEVDVSQAVAERWEARNIAQAAKGKATEK